MLLRFDQAQQHEGPTMILNSTLPDGSSHKNYVDLDANHGVRTNGFGNPAPWDSRSSPRSHDFDAHNFHRRKPDIRHAYESPGGLPFSVEHKKGIEAVQMSPRLPTPRRTEFARVANHLISDEAGRAMNFDQHQVRAVTPKYKPGNRGRIGQRRNDVNTQRPAVGRRDQRGENINAQITNRELANKISISAVPKDTFAQATQQARENGQASHDFMVQARPQLLYHNDATEATSRKEMLATHYRNKERYNSDHNKLKRELLSSDGTRGVLENHNPVQDMQYQHFNNSTMRRTWYGNAPKWDVAPKVDSSAQGWNGRRGPNIAAKKVVSPDKPIMQSPRRGNAYQPDDRVRGKITTRAPTTQRPDAGHSYLARTGNDDGRVMGRPSGSILTADGQPLSLKDRMISGNGNPITGARATKYDMPSFRDIELLNHRQYG